MSQPRALIEKAVELEEIDVDLYRSTNLWRPTGARGVFGGQVVGQSLMAATRTVPSDFSVHSLHSYFLLPGNPDKPILYKVNRVRDGRSYCTRTVHALQNGRNIFVSEISYHVSETSSLEHQYPMPTVRGPETLVSRDQLVENILNDPAVTPEIGNSIKFHIFEPFDLEIRFLEDVSVKIIRDAKPMEPRQSFWIRVAHRLPDDTHLHQAKYFSNFLILVVDEWLLYEMESPRATSGRGFSLGRLFDQSGRLVLSCAQEGTIRIKDPKSKI